MSAWRRKAMEMLPELKKEAVEAESAGMFFIELHMAFVKGHKGRQRENDFIGRCYRYARWCLEQGDTGEGRDGEGRRVATSNDLMTMMAVHFWEHLLDKEEVRRALPMFVTRAELVGFRELFLYGMSEEAYGGYLKEFEEGVKQLEKAGGKKGSGKVKEEQERQGKSLFTE